jgi:hypothetical protein
MPSISRKLTFRAHQSRKQLSCSRILPASLRGLLPIAQPRSFRFWKLFTVASMKFHNADVSSRFVSTHGFIFKLLAAAHVTLAFLGGNSW